MLKINFNKNNGQNQHWMVAIIYKTYRTFSFFNSAVAKSKRLIDTRKYFKLFKK